ncbi:MAG: hypothetical protein AAF927_12490 [Bacteroidota bacterium]
MNQKIMLVLGMLFCLWQVPKLHAQKQISLQLGGQHLNFLDRQASPIPYQGLGPQLRLNYQHQNERHQWSYDLRGGVLAFSPQEPSVQEWRATSLGGTSVGLQASYFYRFAERGDWAFSAGVGLRQEILLDFGAIGGFPWFLGQGNLLLKAKTDYHIGAQHHFSAELGLPAFSWITDMPYNQIPRLEDRVPDVATVFVVGTRSPFWASYQRVDLGLAYRYDWNEKWSFSSRYDWAWYHDAQPKDLWAYQGVLTLGLSRRW